MHFRGRLFPSKPWKHLSIIHTRHSYRERSGSVVECLTGDRGASGSSLTGVTALCPWARHINPSLARKPRLTERSLMGGKESNKIHTGEGGNTYTRIKWKMRFWSLDSIVAYPGQTRLSQTRLDPLIHSKLGHLITYSDTHSFTLALAHSPPQIVFWITIWNMDCKPSRFVTARFLWTFLNSTVTKNRTVIKRRNQRYLWYNCCFFDRLSILQFRRQAHGKPTFSIRTTLLYHCVGSSLFNIEFTDQSALFKQMSLSIGQTFYVMYTEMPKRQRYDAVQYRKQLWSYLWGV